MDTQMWNLERQYKQTYLQGRNRDIDVENGLVHINGEERVGQTERVALTYTHDHV